MSRLARFKIRDNEAWYHVYSRMAAMKGEYLLENPLCQRQLIDMIKHFSKVYVCEVASFCVMGNHYHLVVKFEKERELSRDELIDRACILYPNSVSVLKTWDDGQWAHFNKRIFDLSEYMRNIQAAFARWYNKTFERFGRFWADRFKSLYLGDMQAVLDCMLYVDLNGVRAGFVQRPEEYKGCSSYLRECGQSKWLISLESILGDNEKEALNHYRSLLYYRGAVPTKESQVFISEEIIKEEEDRGFEVSGVYKKRLRYFVDGVMLGTEEFIRQRLNQMRDSGQYKYRRNPAIHLDGIHLTLREQRSHAVSF